MATTYADRELAPSRSQNEDSRPNAGEGGLKGKLLRYKERLERDAVFRVLESTAQGFMKDRVPDHAAAMTYYGVFSLFPLILLFMSLAGLALLTLVAAAMAWSLIDRMIARRKPLP